MHGHAPFDALALQRALAIQFPDAPAVPKQPISRRKRTPAQRRVELRLLAENDSRWPARS
jgi:hypothetical protein